VPSVTVPAILSTPQSIAFYGGLTPSEVRHAYGFDRLSFNGVAGDGRGQTIAIAAADAEFAAGGVATDFLAGWLGLQTRSVRDKKDG